MRLAMARFARGNIFMTVFVARGAGEHGMLRSRSRERVSYRLVARGAVLVRHIGSVGYDEGHMRGMAHRAILVRHVSGMGLVAFQALRDVFVRFVAGRTEEFRVAARMLLRFFPLLRVARQAGSREVRGEFHLEGSVGIRVARVAATDLVMGLAGMARAAEWDNLLLAHHRRVPLMAPRARDGGLVLGAFAVHHRLNARMALDAVRVEEFRGFFFGAEREEHPRKNEDDERKNNERILFLDDTPVFNHSLPPSANNRSILFHVTASP